MTAFVPVLAFVDLTLCSVALATIKTINEINKQLGRNPVLKVKETSNREIVGENYSQTTLRIVLRD